MKNKIWFCSILLFVTFLAFTNSCKKDKKSNNPSIPGIVTDVEGNVYNTITIGSQVWMVENLKVTSYRNGDIIPNVTDSMDWYDLKTGAYCWYNNDSATYASTFGALYNWYAVNDIRNIAPIGWHVPTDADWTILKTYLGGESLAGGKMKETGITHWQSPNTGANNETGFTALPGGYRYINGEFLFIGYYGYWWSATERTESVAWSRNISYSYGILFIYGLNKEVGFSVRCVKD